MQGYPGTGYWHWYCMPIPVRKFYLHRHLKRLENASEGTAENPTPLTNSERVKMIKDAGKVSNDPPKFVDMARSMRNAQK